jgi:uncharacterized protein
VGLDSETIVIALDTNLLIYAFRTAAPEHLKARTAIEAAMNDPRGRGASLPCITEFWTFVTHLSAIGGASSPALATKFVRSLVNQGNVEIWLPAPGFADRLLEMAIRLSASGPRIFDLQIGLIALENGATEIWSHDRNFPRLPGLRVFDPLA